MQDHSSLHGTNFLIAIVAVATFIGGATEVGEVIDQVDAANDRREAIVRVSEDLVIDAGFRALDDPTVQLPAYVPQLRQVVCEVAPEPTVLEDTGVFLAHRIGQPVISGIITAVHNGELVREQRILAGCMALELRDYHSELQHYRGEWQRMLLSRR